jgi:Protein of unknown function (DUF992)
MVLCVALTILFDTKISCEWLIRHLIERRYNMLRKASLAIAAAFVGSTLVLASSAQAQSGVKAGVLTCHVDSGWGFIFGSSRKLNCTYSHDHGSLERYSGTISKFGADIGYTRGGVIAWAVVAPTSDVGKGSLAGDYGGVTGSAAVGVGVGANVLIGGFQKSFTLQPVSVEGLVGLNVAGGIEGVTLTYEGEQ